MQLNNTKDNHYVPKFYLKTFLDTNNHIHFFDKQTKKIYSTKDLRSIAFKKNLYTIQNKINKADIYLFCKLFEISIDIDIQKIFMNTLQSFLNDEFTNLFTITHKNKNIERKINTTLSKMIDEPEISRNQELLFTLYENDVRCAHNYIISHDKMLLSKESKDGPLAYLAYKILNFIFEMMFLKISKVYDKIGGDIDILNKPKIKNIYEQNAYYDLLHYMIIQYFRTNKRINIIKETLKSLNNPVFKLDGITPTAHNIMFLLIHYHSLNISDKLINGGYKIILLKNCTKVPFVTSDNPAVNSYANLIKDFGVQNIDLEIFFPLSPKLALLLTKICIDKNYNKEKSELIIDSNEKVNYWNKLIFDESDRFIYSASLDNIKKFQYL
jgi:hypothetical protein